MSQHRNAVLASCMLSFLVVGSRWSAAADPLPAQEEATAPAPFLGKPVGYWSLDQIDIVGSKAVDRSGNGHDGIIDGARPVAGKAAQALEFNGSEGSVTVEGLDIEGTELSLSLWLRKDASAGGTRRLIVFDGYTQVGFVDRDMFVHTGKPAKADFNTPVADAGIVPVRWHYLVVTWDTAAPADNVKVYVDGALKLAADLKNALGTDLSVTKMMIASNGLNSWPAPSQVLAGTVDEVALYDTALTAEDIDKHFSEIAKIYGAKLPVAAGAAPAGEVIRFPRKTEELYVPKVTYSGPKKLIRRASELGSRLLGATSISEADLPAKVKVWQDTGFDGLIFSIASHDRSKAERNMTGQWWSLVGHNYEEFVPEIKAFQSVKDWGRLTDNYLCSSMAIWGGHKEYRCQDWFTDADWDIILSNVRLQVRIARECGFKGIVLDTEQYVGHHAQGTWHIPFSYPLYAESGYKAAGEEQPRPFSEVAAKIRQRGTQYARAICGAFPGVRLMLVGDQQMQQWRAGPLEENHAGLYPTFIDGLLLGLDHEATIIWGSKLTYSMTQYRDIIRVRQSYDEAIDQFCKAPAHLKRKMTFAAGIWADPGRTWSDTDVSVNARGPANLKKALRNAFRASGEYAWLYGEKSRFLTTDPTPLMREYLQANIDAHQIQGPPSD